MQFPATMRFLVVFLLYTVFFWVWSAAFPHARAVLNGLNTGDIAAVVALLCGTDAMSWLATRIVAALKRWMEGS